MDQDVRVTERWSDRLSTEVSYREVEDVKLMLNIIDMTGVNLSADLDEITIHIDFDQRRAIKDWLLSISQSMRLVINSYSWTKRFQNRL